MKKQTEPNYAVSACLCGKPCRYDGASRPYDDIREFAEQHHALLICPESVTMPTPRPPSERTLDGRVISVNGDDVTSAFYTGAQNTLELCREKGITHAILKERSPSCGVHQRYDGTFTKHLIDGMGVTAELLYQNGIVVSSEEDFQK